MITDEEEEVLHKTLITVLAEQEFFSQPNAMITIISMKNDQTKTIMAPMDATAASAANALGTLITMFIEHGMLSMENIVEIVSRVLLGLACKESKCEECDKKDGCEAYKTVQSIINPTQGKIGGMN